MVEVVVCDKDAIKGLESLIGASQLELQSKQASASNLSALPRKTEEGQANQSAVSTIKHPLGATRKVEDRAGRGPHGRGEGDGRPDKPQRPSNHHAARRKRKNDHTKQTL